MKNKCDCYVEEKEFVDYTPLMTPVYRTIPLCYGTKERDRCSCGGDRAKCDIYPEVREKAKKEKETMKFRIIKYYERFAAQVWKDEWINIGSPNGFSTVDEAERYCKRYKFEQEEKIIKEFEL